MDITEGRKGGGGEGGGGGGEQPSEMRPVNVSISIMPTAGI